MCALLGTHVVYVELFIYQPNSFFMKFQMSSFKYTVKNANNGGTYAHWHMCEGLDNEGTHVSWYVYVYEWGHW